ncbi:hypothetical protein CENDO_07100 [Corynebacterium endometrii]|uniref:Lipopolysaccharide assembly protein A domain-containing protein n=2 Tax=Corynebacterium endometrii TaxID=2488819 RepID=A0A4P7QII3_9CORY|nr:hypothetical protein CENDO_07100 [Corynebacterium endometrii]
MICMTNPNYDPNAIPANSGYAADPETAQAPAPASRDQVEYAEPKKAPKDAGKAKGSFAASTWAALIVGFLLLILLIVFILQNMHEVELNFISWTVQFPAGIAFLIFAVAGALIMALVGGWRMFELRRQMKKQAKLYG